MDATTYAEPGAGLIPLGLHFGLPAAQYHADPALGSSSLRLLAKNPFTWWWKSPLNPGWKPEERETESLINGRALHKLIYEGEAAFAQEFISGPDQSGMTTGEKSTSTRKFNEAAAASGRTPIKFEAWQRIRIAAQMITKNSDLSGVFSGGRSEVSFFWTINGVRCKCRWDYIKTSVRTKSRATGEELKTLVRTTGIGDLKSIANQYEMDLEQACYNAIATYRYDAQVAHYLDALLPLREAVRDGLVFGKHDPDWVLALSKWDLRAFQIIFHQTEGAPITHSMIFSPDNPIVELGRAVVRKGLERYQFCMERFGPREAWLMLEPAREAMIESMPGYYARS